MLLPLSEGTQRIEELKTTFLLFGSLGIFDWYNPTLVIVKGNNETQLSPLLGLTKPAVWQ